MIQLFAATERPTKSPMAAAFAGSSSVSLRTISVLIPVLIPVPSPMIGGEPTL